MVRVRFRVLVGVRVRGAVHGGMGPSGTKKRRFRGVCSLMRLKKHAGRTRIILAQRRNGLKLSEHHLVDKRWVVIRVSCSTSSQRKNDHLLKSEGHLFLVDEHHVE